MRRAPQANATSMMRSERRQPWPCGRHGLQNVRLSADQCFHALLPYGLDDVDDAQRWSSAAAGEERSDETDVGWNELLGGT